MRVAKCLAAKSLGPGNKFSAWSRITEMRTQRISMKPIAARRGRVVNSGVGNECYMVKGYDCARSQFAFTGLPPYPCPIEMEG